MPKYINVSNHLYFKHALCISSNLYPFVQNVRTKLFLGEVKIMPLFGSRIPTIVCFGNTWKKFLIIPKICFQGIIPGKFFWVLRCQKCKQETRRTKTIYMFFCNFIFIYIAFVFFTTSVWLRFSIGTLFGPELA